MTADVLQYNSLNEINKGLSTKISELESCISSLDSSCQTLVSEVESALATIISLRSKSSAKLVLISEGTGWTGDLKVCDTSGNFRCGACCAWTVPAGVTCARFQLWGAGAGTGSACCCGFSPIGGTGAYASVIIPVTAGDTYTLCAGCAYCCYANGSTSNANGCPSFILGTGLTNFCAEGGEGSICCELLTRGIFASSVGQYLGGCICNTGSDACWHSSASSYFNLTEFNNAFPMISSCKTFYGTADNGVVYGVRGSFGYIAVNCNSTICVVHPPIYGFASTSCCACCISAVNCGGCCRSAGNGYMQIPGAGGWASMKCGGQTTSPGGDSGRFGMVCVSYK